MRRAFRTSGTIALVTVLVSFGAIQARADRVISTLPAMLSSSGTALSFGRLLFPVTGDLARAVAPPTNGSFSVNDSQLNLGKTTNYRVIVRTPILAESQPNAPAAPAVPEPPTMFLLGTGLVGAAAVLRKRLKDRRPK